MTYLRLVRLVVGIRMRARAHGRAGIVMLRTVTPGGAGDTTWALGALLRVVESGERVIVIEAERKVELVVHALDGMPPYLRAFRGTEATDALTDLPQF